MPPIGRWKIVTATVRVRSATGGNVTPIPIPEGWSANASLKFTPGAMITAPSSNSGTIYFSDKSSVSNATTRETTMTPLTAEKTLSFTSQFLGESGIRMMVFGTGYTYIHASATSQKAILTYFQQV